MPAAAEPCCGEAHLVGQDEKRASAHTSAGPLLLCQPTGELAHLSLPLDKVSADSDPHTNLSAHANIAGILDQPGTGINA